MKQTEHNTSFTALDIQRYYAGEMSMQERHALERAALDDPFLADAIEGYQNTTTAQADLAELQQRLTTSKQPERKGAFLTFFQKPWVRVAALVLLLAGAGWGVYQLSFTKSTDLTLSKATPQSNVNDTVSLSTGSTTTDNNVSTLTDSSSIVIETAPKDLEKKIDNKPIVTQPPMAVKTTTFKDATVTSLANRTAGIEISKPVTTEVATAVPIVEARAQKEDVAKNTFKGQIVDGNGNPVPNASIAINGRREGTVSNEQGLFSLTTKDSVLNATVAAVGFEANRIYLTNSEEKKIVLNESSAALQEVVVVGYGQKRRREVSAAKKSTAVEDLEPEEGWSRYNNYVSENLQIPEEVAVKKLTGEVELSFEVNQKGEPVNIKVEKSLCESCDKEAIRLLKEGPSWKKKKRKSGKLRIRF